ncbi:MAG: hypothetical protein U0869_15465 [Chloroflexota bacterium]
MTIIRSRPTLPAGMAIPAMTASRPAAWCPSTVAVATARRASSPASAAWGTKTDRALVGGSGRLHGVVTLTCLDDGVGRLTIRCAGLPVDAPITITAYRGLAMPATLDRVLGHWRHGAVRRGGEGTLVVAIDAAELASMRAARAAGGMTIRLRAGDDAADARFAA